MWKEKIRLLSDVLIRHSKIVFPIVIVIAVAVTVAFALGAGKVEDKLKETLEPEPMESSSVMEEASKEEIPEVMLERSQDAELCSLVYTYFDAFANGNIETIKSISNYVEDTECIWIQELSKYIESYPLVEVYTKQGPVENSYIAYVYYQMTFHGKEAKVPGLKTFYICMNESGAYYLNDGETEESILEYMKTISLQEDVVELINKSNAEYNELLVNDKNLADYIAALESEVQQATGEALAALVAETQPLEDSKTGESEGTGESTQTGNESGETTSATTQGPVYATATTTVNVRSSDSTQADKLGKVAGGTKVQVIEQQVNGWTRIVFEGKDGYIKSEFLTVEQSENFAADGNVIKTVKATTNVNLRKEASESASKLGVVIGGDSMDVLSEANGWTQVNYKGTVGYVKSEYVQ